MGLLICSWNLNGLEERHLDLRTEAACFHLLLRERLPDVLLLQEVVPRSFQAHLKHHLAAAGFSWVPAGPEGQGNYFCVLAVRAPLALREAVFAPFRGSVMGRGLLSAEVAWGERRLTVCTAHLESGREMAGERSAQARAVLGELAACPGPAVFAGDTNLADREWEGLGGREGVCDAWEAAGADAKQRYTWDSRRAGSTRRRPARFRFDRLWFNPGFALEAGRFALSGDTPVQLTRGMRPSDHLCVEVELTVP